MYALSSHAANRNHKVKTKDILFFIGLVLLLGGGGYAVYTMTPGLRNNNPGNIRRDDSDGIGTQWIGLAPIAQQTDDAFWVFSQPIYGIRAIAKILSNYYARGLTSVAQIISTWAPSNENDTNSYIKAVANEIGVNPNEPIYMATDLNNLVKAIIKHENGLNPYSDELINSAVGMS